MKIILVILFVPILALAHDDSKGHITQEQMEKHIEKIAKHWSQRISFSDLYLGPANDVLTITRALEKFRESKNRLDKSSREGIEILESELDGLLIGFLKYDEVDMPDKKLHHAGIIKFLERAADYRTKYPRKPETEQRREINKFVIQVLQYAKKEATRLENENK